MATLQEVGKWMMESKNTVVLTGAGMSTESGLPDFRSKEGWWRSIDPSTVANVDALNRNYDLFHEFYRDRIISLSHCKPHEGHLIVAEWEKKGIISHVATQNVDGFHHQAGNRNVSELHGNIRTFRCHNCGAGALEELFLNGDNCRECGGRLRPNVVLFGEMLPQEAWETSLDAIDSADLVLVIGSSLQVSPVNQLPSMTKGKTVWLNKEIDSFSQFDKTIEGSAKNILQQLNNIIK
ncbi:NAD-dependent deacetylase [Thalassorhabdus alkalitolerans]|uniref:protein acetyllysine N-acetyltransferase n=1 Tax=Thalassorhabdus alkalitolerans TaxID=2282697 RepID=A0ABW0YVX5_9BACI